MNFRIEYIDKTKKPVKQATKGKIAIRGKTIAITGSLPGMNRRQAELWASTKKNAFVATKVDRTVNYLIVGKSNKNGASSKIATAQKLGIKMISFDEVA